MYIPSKDTSINQSSVFLMMVMTTSPIVKALHEKTNIGKNWKTTVGNNNHVPVDLIVQHYYTLFRYYNV